MWGIVVGMVAAASPRGVSGRGGGKDPGRGKGFGHLAYGGGRWRLSNGTISAATARAMAGMAVGLGLGHACCHGQHHPGGDIPRGPTRA